VLTASQKSSSFSNTYANECLRCVGRRLVEVRYFASGAAKHEFAIKMKDLGVASVLENGTRPSCQELPFSRTTHVQAPILEK